MPRSPNRARHRIFDLPFLLRSTMPPLPRCLRILSAVLLAVAAQAGDSPTLDEVFRQPGEDTRPWNYWYWMAGNISKEGITRDLEAMARAGIGAAAMGDINDGPAGPVKSLSPEWWDLVRHAVRECRRTGVAFGMFNSPGWSQSGGPWVGPGDTMRALFLSETPVTGRYQGQLPAPCPAVQDLAVLAVPLPAGSRDSVWMHHPQVTSAAGIAGLDRLMDGNPATVVELPTANVDAIIVKIMKLICAVPMPTTRGPIKRRISTLSGSFGRKTHWCL